MKYSFPRIFALSAGVAVFVFGATVQLLGRNPLGGTRHGWALMVGSLVLILPPISLEGGLRGRGTRSLRSRMLMKRTLRDFIRFLMLLALYILTLQLVIVVLHAPGWTAFPILIAVSALGSFLEWRDRGKKGED